jgi:hypothetical protein
MSWDAEFFQPIQVPGKRKQLVTLRDAVEYMTSLPRDERGADYWWLAVTLLAIIGERGGCMFFAERAVAFGLRKGAQNPPPEFDPERKRDRPLEKTKTEEGRMTSVGGLCYPSLAAALLTARGINSAAGLSRLLNNR